MKRLFCALLGLMMVFAPEFVFADDVDNLLRQEMQRHQIAGLSMIVVKGGQQVKAAAYGVANLELDVPATTNTVYEIGSVTKQFTAAGILLLMQDGRLSLDDKISRHLKHTPASWANITVRNLLTHTSGITNYTGLDGFELRKHLTQEQFIREIGKYPLSFQPGDKWSYCNSGFSLLGYIIENVSGTNYWDFQRARIFQPLGMDATRERDPRAIIPNRASGYELSKHVSINRDYDLTDIFSAGAIVSTVVDLAKWDAALNSDILLTSATREQMWSPMKLNSGKIQNYGFGWFLDPYKGHKNIGHTGATSGFSCAIQRFPDDALSVMVLCNADELSIASTLAKKVAELYFENKN
jgi:CubicO group peptidase (beta-lactamase class C family)